jgi:hypothetical protein
MGIVTDAYQRPLIYDHTKSNFTIREGIIVAKNKKVYDVCQNRITNGLGMDIPVIHKQIVDEADRQKIISR